MKNICFMIMFSLTVSLMSAFLLLHPVVLVIVAIVMLIEIETAPVMEEGRG